MRGQTPRTPADRQTDRQTDGRTDARHVGDKGTWETQLASMPLSASPSRAATTHSEPTTRPIACSTPLAAPDKAGHSRNVAAKSSGAQSS
jgi:hypothetical protein